MDNQQQTWDELESFVALERLIAIARRDTGQSRRVADFLLSWWNAQSCGGFDPTDMWAVDHAIRDDMLIVLQLIGHGGARYPDALGYGDAFKELVRLWRPHLAD